MRPGFVQRSALGGRAPGHGAHSGADVGPHTAMLEYWLAVQRLSYTHGVHWPVKGSRYHPAVPIHGRHCVLHLGRAHPSGAVSSRWHGVSPPL